MTRKTTWAPEHDEALLRTMKKNLTTAEAFVADYRKESGDTIHGVGAIAFRAIQAASFLREMLDPKLRHALQVAGRNEQGIRRTPAPTVAAAPAPKAANDDPPAKATKPDADGEVVIDGVAYLDRAGAMRVLRVSKSTLRYTHERNLIVRADGLRPLYQKASVLALATVLHAPKVKVVKVPEKAPDALEINGVPCISTAAAAARFGIDARPFGNMIARRMTAHWPEGKHKSPYYAEADVAAMLVTVAREREAAKAKAAPAPSNVVPITSAPTAKAPVKTMADMTLAEKLDAVSRALAQGVITPDEHRAKVRVIAASA